MTENDCIIYNNVLKMKIDAIGLNNRQQTCCS